MTQSYNHVIMFVSTLLTIKKVVYNINYLRMHAGIYIEQKYIYTEQNQFVKLFIQ